MRMTVPLVFRTSTLPSWMNWVGETYPETESRSILRTITFLCVEGIEKRVTSCQSATSEIQYRCEPNARLLRRETSDASLGSPRSFVGQKRPPQDDNTQWTEHRTSTDWPLITDDCLSILAPFGRKLPESVLAVAKM